MTDFLDKHKVFRRITLLWAICLITWVSYQVFTDLKLITAPVATALTTVVGILATVIAFYVNAKFRSEREGEGEE